MGGVMAGCAAVVTPSLQELNTYCTPGGPACGEGAVNVMAADWLTFTDGFTCAALDPTCTWSPAGLVGKFTVTMGGALVVTPKDVRITLSSGDESVMPEL